MRGSRLLPSHFLKQVDNRFFHVELPGRSFVERDDFLECPVVFQAQTAAGKIACAGNSFIQNATAGGQVKFFTNFSCEANGNLISIWRDTGFEIQTCHF